MAQKALHQSIQVTEAGIISGVVLEVIWRLQEGFFENSDMQVAEMLEEEKDYNNMLAK